MKKILKKIAKDTLGLETLETRNSGGLDFKECAVWGIEKALTQAYNAGKSFKKKSTKPLCGSPRKECCLKYTVIYYGKDKRMEHIEFNYYDDFLKWYNTNQNFDIIKIIHGRLQCIPRTIEEKFEIIHDMIKVSKKEFLQNYEVDTSMYTLLQGLSNFLIEKFQGECHHELDGGRCVKCNKWFAPDCEDSPDGICHYYDEFQEDSGTTVPYFDSQVTRKRYFLGSEKVDSYNDICATKDATKCIFCDTGYFKKIK